MALVNTIDEQLSAAEMDIAAALAAEYWNPTRDWKFWEYIGPQMTVLDQLDWPGTIEHTIALQLYGTDRKLAKELLASLRNL